MIYTILSEQPGTENLAWHDLLQKAGADLDPEHYEAYYFAYGPWGYTEHSELAKIPYRKKTVFWIAVDSLVSSHEYDWYKDIKPHGLLGLETICRIHPAIDFFLITEQHKLSHLIDVTNLEIVEITPWCWRYDKARLQYERASTLKTPSSGFACFVNGCRWHRIATLSWLLSKGYDTNGQITIGDKAIERCRQFDQVNGYLTYRYDWPTYQGLDVGFQRLKNLDFNRLVLPPYLLDINPNITNYNENLLPIYQQTTVEVLCGTIFSDPGIFLTEKELQAFYGCNFQIVLAPAGTVKYFRSMGFDMFDDVVDHSYDTECDPGKRLYMALEKNKDLLSGHESLLGAWKSRVKRFEANCDRADTIMSELDQKFLLHFQQKISDHCAKQQNSVRQYD